MSQARTKLVVGNWKMNGSKAANVALISGIAQAWKASLAQAPRCEVVACVPNVFLEQISALVPDFVDVVAIKTGAQDLSAHTSGAYTGEVSGAMLAEFGVAFAIVGHSERRQYHGETNASVAAKAHAALNHGIRPIVCVGESLAQRDAGETLGHIHQQLAVVLGQLGDKVANTVVAYEPVWAIGTGRTATPEQAQEVHAAIRAQLQAVGAGHVPVLYGGSMNAANAAQLLAQPDVDGGLIGGASLKPADFVQIILAADRAAQNSVST
jgi:triosephosphate isomerase (TIM)